MNFDIDETIHAPKRLAICSMLSSTSTVEFGVIRDELGVSDSVASKQLKVLVDAGYVKLESNVAKSSRRPRMWASLTPLGRVAFSEYVQKVQEIMTGGMSD